MVDSTLVLADLRLSELKLMVELAQTRSLRELSRRQSVNPSKLSKIIQRIEKKVGLPLIQRSSRGMVFTLEGMQFLKTARRILELSPALRSGSQAELPPGKTYGLAGMSYLNQYLMSDCLNAIKAKHDRLNFRLLEVPAKDLVVSGLKGIFEMAIHFRKIDWPKTWTSKKIGMSRSGLFGRHQHPLGKKTNVAELTRYPFVTPLRWTKNGIQDGDDLCPLPLQDRLHGDGTMTAAAALGLLKTSDQLSFLPEIVTRESILKKELMEIKVAEWGETEEPLYFSVRSDLVSKRLYDHFVEAFDQLLTRPKL